jgi:SAM-dependent methyltransferase
MASGWEPSGLSDAEVADGEAYHRALYHDGDLTRPAGWHHDSVQHLLALALPHIKDGALVVDYGAGTGGSAIELLRVLDAADISIELVLVDPLNSWFGKAREILGERDDVHFELSISEDELGKTVFRELDEMLGGRKADVIISSSTLHLVPIKALDDLALQFANCLVPGGVFVWDSGDVESALRPSSAACLHDPYRGVREHLRDDEARKGLLAEMAAEDAARAERRVDRIFPVPFSIEVLMRAISSAGLMSRISDHVVEFSNEDAERFILVPRLAEIAAPLIEGDERDAAIRSAIAKVLANMREAGTAGESSYRSYWVYGYHVLP